MKQFLKAVDKRYEDRVNQTSRSLQIINNVNEVKNNNKNY